MLSSCYAQSKATRSSTRSSSTLNLATLPSKDRRNSFTSKCGVSWMLCSFFPATSLFLSVATESHLMLAGPSAAVRSTCSPGSRQ